MLTLNACLGKEVRLLGEKYLELFFLKKNYICQHIIPIHTQKVDSSLMLIERVRVIQKLI